MTKPNDEQQLLACPFCNRQIEYLGRDFYRGKPDELYKHPRSSGDYAICPLEELVFNKTLWNTRHPSPRAGLSLESILDILYKQFDVDIYEKCMKEEADRISPTTATEVMALHNNVHRLRIKLQCVAQEIMAAQPKDDGLVEALKDVIDTVHMHSLTELQGSYRLVNDGEIAQAIERAEQALSHHEKRKL